MRMILYDHISPFSTFHFLVIPILRRQLCCKMRCVVVVFISSSHFLTSRNHDLRIYQIWVSLSCACGSCLMITWVVKYIHINPLVSLNHHPFSVFPCLLIGTFIKLIFLRISFLEMLNISKYIPHRPCKKNIQFTWLFWCNQTFGIFFDEKRVFKMK